MHQTRNPIPAKRIPSIPDLIAADAGVSPEFTAAIAQVGSDRWLEVRQTEGADQHREEYAERIERGE
jgi:hypothetical protein